MARLQRGIRIGPYHVDGVLKSASGGFSQVVFASRALEKGKRQQVALKVARVPTGRDRNPDEMRAAYNQSIMNEVSTLRQLKHPNIVQLFPMPRNSRRVAYHARAVQVEGQPWYFCMEYLAGGSIEEYARKKKRLPIPMAVEIASQVCMVLDYMHAKDYAHMDIKAQNVLFRSDASGATCAPQAVVIDFGTARREGLSAEIDGASLHYLSPERVREMRQEVAPEQIGNRPAVDIYALGVMLYRMLAGRVPFQGRRERVQTAIITQEATHPSKYAPGLRKAPELEPLIMKMLSKDPDARPTAYEVLVALERICPPPRFHGDGIGVQERGKSGRRSGR